MRLTPIDIQQQQFSRSMRGFDRREVEVFLDLAAQQMGEVIAENNELRVEMKRLKQEVEDHRDREETLREAMLTAQRAIEEIRDQAHKEAVVIVADAELRAEKILHDAHNRLTHLIDDVNQLKRQRVRAIEEVRGVLNTHRRILDVYNDDTESNAPEGELKVLKSTRSESVSLLETKKAVGD